MRRLICVVGLVAFLAAAGCSGTPTKPVQTAAPGNGPGEKGAQPTAPKLGNPPPR